MYLKRALFKDEILTEFIIPEEGTDKVIIIATGAPGYPNQKSFAQFLMKQGFAVFVPRYRGSWESEGEFLVKPLQDDILDIVDELPKGFSDVLGENTYMLEPEKIIVIGGSFGGPAALFSALDERIDKVVAVCPVVDWTADSIAEPFEVLKPFMQKGFGGGYRMSEETWQKLERGEIYNPVSHVTKLRKVKDKIWIIHAEDDESVLPEPIKEFAREVGCEITTLEKGGHFGTSFIQKKWFLRRKLKKYLVT